MFEKIIGTILGICVLVYAIQAGSEFFIWQASIFTLLNLVLSFDMFQSFVDMFDQSDFGAILMKWVILAILSSMMALVGMLIF
jgi:hypothetical protein